MLLRMTWEQFFEWFQYFQEEPFGEDRADLRAGSIVASIYNVNRSKGGKVLTAADCRLEFRKQRPGKGAPYIPGDPVAERARFDQFKQMIIATATQTR